MTRPVTPLLSAYV